MDPASTDVRPSPTRPARRRLRVLLAGVVALALVAGCAGDDDGDGGAGSSDESTTAEGTGPRTVEHAFGTTQVPADVERLVSASPSATGHLLAIGAPLVASGATTPSTLADEQGFFVQWADIAEQRGVEPIAGPEVDVEAIAAADPDLIVGTSTGADAVSETAYDQLSQIAPTLVYDLSGISWQEATRALGAALGRSDEAEATIAEFDELVEEVAADVEAGQEAVAMVASPQGINVFTPASAHGQLLAALGYTYHEVPAGAGAAPGGRSDIVAVSEENAAVAFGDSTLFFVFADEAAVRQVEASRPVMANLAGFREDRAHALGFSSFRLDRYSAEDVVEIVAGLDG